MKLLETLSIDLSTLCEVYKPHYQPGTKTPGGSVKDWFKAMNVSQADVDEAVKLVVELPSYKKLLSNSFVANKTAKLAKNGTFQFKHDNGNIYSVYGNGVIRQENPKNRSVVSHQITKLKAPKPALVHGNPVKSLLKIYDNAFKELVSKKLSTDEAH